MTDDSPDLEELRRYGREAERDRLVRLGLHRECLNGLSCYACGFALAFIYGLREAKKHMGTP
jgi:hypothetical protein